VAWRLHLLGQAHPAHTVKENIMKLQFGSKQLVFGFGSSAFEWFHGHTQRMSLTSLSLLFIQFSVFARHSNPF
jgi:hypothetical protein